MIYYNNNWQKPIIVIYPRFSTDLILETAAARYDRISLKILEKHYPPQPKLKFDLIYNLLLNCSIRQKFISLFLLIFNYLHKYFLFLNLKFTVFYFHLTNYDFYLNWCSQNFLLFSNSRDVFILFYVLCKLKIKLLRSGEEIILFKRGNRARLFFYSFHQIKIVFKELGLVYSEIFFFFVINKVNTHFWDYEIVFKLKRYKNLRGISIDKNLWDPFFNTLLRVFYFLERYQNLKVVG